MDIETIIRLKETITEHALACYWEGYYLYGPGKDSMQKHAIYKQKVFHTGEFIDNMILKLIKENKK